MAKATKSKKQSTASVQTPDLSDYNFVVVYKDSSFVDATGTEHKFIDLLERFLDSSLISKMQTKQEVYDSMAVHKAVNSKNGLQPILDAIEGSTTPDGFIRGQKKPRGGVPMFEFFPQSDAGARGGRFFMAVLQPAKLAVMLCAVAHNENVHGIKESPRQYNAFYGPKNDTAKALGDNAHKFIEYRHLYQGSLAQQATEFVMTDYFQESKAEEVINVFHEVVSYNIRWRENKENLYLQSLIINDDIYPSWCGVPLCTSEYWQTHDGDALLAQTQQKIATALKLTTVDKEIKESLRKTQNILTQMCTLPSQH